MTRLPEMLRVSQPSILNDWVKAQVSAATFRRDLISEETVREESRTFLRLLATSAQGSALDDVTAPGWAPVLEFLSGLSRSRTEQGFSPSETATFVLSLKQPVFAMLRALMRQDPEGAAEEMWTATTFIDQLALHTTDAFQKSREAIIARQNEEMLELSTPVVELWDGILALPLIGTLDSARTQVVMESLLERLVGTRSAIAIIDITGVPTVDTLVAQHLLKTVAAARLMGADCIISGIRPQIAQTLVHLGVTLGDVTTKATLAGAFTLALERVGQSVGRVNRPAL